MSAGGDLREKEVLRLRSEHKPPQTLTKLSMGGKEHSPQPKGKYLLNCKAAIQHYNAIVALHYCITD